MSLQIVQDQAADAVLAEHPFALLLGMLLSQDVPVEVAFAGPAKILDRFGTLDPHTIESAPADDFARMCATDPPVHPYPDSMAVLIQAVARFVVVNYGGDAASIWDSAGSGDLLLSRLVLLPGFTKRRAQMFVALLGKQLGVRPDGWEHAAGVYAQPEAFRSVADVHDQESLDKVRQTKSAKRQSAHDEGDDDQAPDDVGGPENEDEDPIDMTTEDQPQAAPSDAGAAAGGGRRGPLSDEQRSERRAAKKAERQAERRAARQEAGETGAGKAKGKGKGTGKNGKGKGGAGKGGAGKEKAAGAGRGGRSGAVVDDESADRSARRAARRAAERAGGDEAGHGKGGGGKGGLGKGGFGKGGGKGGKGKGGKGGGRAGRDETDDSDGPAQGGRAAKKAAKAARGGGGGGKGPGARAGKGGKEADGPIGAGAGRRGAGRRQGGPGAGDGSAAGVTGSETTTSGADEGAANSPTTSETVEQPVTGTEPGETAGGWTPPDTSDAEGLDRD